MASGSATQWVEQVDKVKLRVMVNKVKAKVLYAEAGKDFVDVLFSFLTLPLGTIGRLVAKESNIVGEVKVDVFWVPLGIKSALVEK